MFYYRQSAFFFSCAMLQSWASDEGDWRSFLLAWQKLQERGHVQLIAKCSGEADCRKGGQEEQADERIAE
ncbi:hypothetical protein MKZ02_01325 [Pseudobacillus sp. FSL P4-0506]|uniref:hypothetical protein n=1 Tax=unclassified Pseudobacillus TaxID=2619284 RepID=UPI0030FB6277